MREMLMTLALRRREADWHGAKTVNHDLVEAYLGEKPDQPLVELLQAVKAEANQLPVGSAVTVTVSVRIPEETP